MSVLLVVALLGYSSPASYAQPVLPEGGGGGRWFTGSPAEGFDCSVCHAGGEPIEFDIQGLPVEGWSPGQTYELQVRWNDPTAHVSLLAEFARADGAGIGRVELAPEASLLQDERCTSGPRAAKIHALEQEAREITSFDDCGARLLRLAWTAPEQADDDAWLFLAGVHSDASEDAAGDGVMIQRIRLPAPAKGGACTLVETPPAPLGIALLGLLALGLVRPWRARAALVVLLVFVGGCARVQPHQRGRLAGSDMQLELDAELCAGRTHAVEYREGSAGGLGGGGGGCGCN
jgi:hypothetical protein